MFFCFDREFFYYRGDSIDFYTKKWNDYVYKEWIDLFIKKYHISDVGYINDLFDLKISLTRRDDNKIIKEIMDETFIYYSQRINKYINRYDYFEKKFGKYEKLSAIDYYDENVFFERINNFVEKNKNKLEDIVNRLISKGIDVNINIDDINFKMLAINKITFKTKDIYEKIRQIYLENVDKYDDFSMEEYSSIDFIENDVCTLLTDYDTYLESREDKFDYKMFDMFFYEHGKFIDCKRINNDLILEIVTDYNDRIVRFTFKNVIVSDDVDYNDLDLYSCYDYGNYEDFTYYMVLHVGNRKIDKKIELIADKIILEDVTDEVSDKYRKKLVEKDVEWDKQSEDWRIKFDKILNIMGKDFCLFYKLYGVLDFVSYNYNDSNLIINYNDSLSDEKYVLEFVQSKVQTFYNGKKINLSDFQKRYFNIFSKYDLICSEVKVFKNMDVEFIENGFDVKMTIEDIDSNIFEILIRCIDIRVEYIENL